MTIAAPATPPGGRVAPILPFVSTVAQPNSEDRLAEEMKRKRDEEEPTSLNLFLE